MIARPEVLLKLIEEKINELSTEVRSPKNLYEPINYLMQLGGKRLRPSLVLLSYQLFEDNPSNVLNQASAVEVFHNFTLMHDDIMDEAPLRRSKPTVHEKWNINTGILSGDVMLVKAYQLLLSKHENSYDILNDFNKCAVEVCEGQQLDMDFEERTDVEIDEYMNMIRLKTAVLLGYSLELGALLANEKEEAKKLYEMGVCMGLGFQLMDDYLDAFGDPKKFGKQVGGDILCAKKTFLTIKALERAEGNEKSVLESVFISKNSKLKSKEKVKAVKEIYIKTGVDQLIRETIEDYFKKAHAMLSKIEAPLNRKSILKDYVNYLTGRDS